MSNFNFHAVDEKGSVYPFLAVRNNNRISLTLKKEFFKNVKTLRALGSFTEAKAGDVGYYVQPRNINMMGDFLTFFKEREDTTYTFGRPVLSLFGIKKPGLCALVRIERNYKYSLETVVKDSIYTLSVVFNFTTADIPYDDIRMEILLLPENAEYADMAKAERELRLARKEITTLAEKCERDAVDYARLHPLIRIRLGWKPSPSPVFHQTLENEPDMFVACDFKRVREIADELKRQQVEGAELQLVGWNISGHDGRFPQLFPVDPRLGGEDELRKTIAYVKERGYRISLHTNLIDAYEIADTFTWEDICVKRDGNYNQTGHYSGGYAYHVCPEKQLKNNRRDLPDVAALGTNGLHFTDVISIVEPDDCHNKEHPVPTGKGVRIAQTIMQETKDNMGAFSSEGAMDFAVGMLDYALYVTFGDAFAKIDIPVADKYLPFYELIYHGILLYNPMSSTVNYPIKTARERLTAYLHGGKPTFYFFSKFRTGGSKNWMGEIDLVTTTDDNLTFAIKTVKDGVTEYRNGAFDKRQFIFMKDYEVLDNGLEAAVYEDGSIVVGNFGETEQVYRGETIPPGDYRLLFE